MTEALKNSIAAAEPAPAPAPAPAKPRLLTRAQVLAALASEIAASSLTEVARGYDLSPQQLNDVMHGRAKLSARVRERLALRLHEFYERIGRAGGDCDGRI